MPNWVQILGALATPAIALGAAFIAAAQWQINRTNLRFQLFDRIYEGVMPYLSFPDR